MRNLPKVTARPGDDYLIIVPNYWGKGKTLDEARRQVLVNRPSDTKQWIIYSVDPGSYLDDMGGLNRPAGAEPALELARS